MVRKTLNLTAVMLLSLTLWACAGIKGTPPRESRPPADTVSGCEFYDSGLASWYGNEMAIGKRNGAFIFNATASGEKFIPSGLTAAHRTLPFGTLVKVVPDGFKGNPDGVVVRINDRGPFIKGRIIDLSAGAAKQLGMPNTKKVKVYRCS